MRENGKLSAADWETLRQRLAKLDTASKIGPWTQRILTLIASHEGRPAGELAQMAGVEKEWLKMSVRKLKNLGLTESLQPGYRISLCGQTWRAME